MVNLDDFDSNKHAGVLDYHLFRDESICHTAPMYRIMFICTGNICRSPLAHAVFANLIEEQALDSAIAIESSGTDAWHIREPMDPRMRQTAARHGLDFDHRARRLTAKDLAEYDLLLTMDRSNYRNTVFLARNEDERTKVRMFRDYDPAGPGDVPDPWYGGMKDFEAVWVIVQRTCDALLKEIQKTLL